MVTEETFPGILSRSKVTKHHEIELSPIQTAVQSIEKKNDEITTLYTSVESKDKGVGSLTMALNGIIDAEVNGGIQKYREAFLTPEYLEINPGNEAIEDTQRLKNAIKQSIEIVGTALKVHRELCPENMVQLQEKLDSKFHF